MDTGGCSTLETVGVATLEFGLVCTASCGCPLLGCALFWFLGVAKLVVPSPCDT